MPNSMILPTYYEDDYESKFRVINHKLIHIWHILHIPLLIKNYTSYLNLLFCNSSCDTLPGQDFAYQCLYFTIENNRIGIIIESRKVTLPSKVEHSNSHDNWAYTRYFCFNENA